MDQLTGVYPVTDHLAFVVRSGSIWSMSETGNFDVPFQFSHSVPIGSRFPLGVVRIPGGIIVPGDDAVYEITTGGYKLISDDAADYILKGINAPRRVCGVLSSDSTRYALFTPNSVTSMLVHVCHRTLGNQWTTLEFPFPLLTMAPGRFESALLTDELVGLTDDLAGLTDNLGVTSQALGLMFVPDRADSYVITEDESQTDNPGGRDVNASGGRVGGGFSLQTGGISPASPLERVTVNDVQLLAKVGRQCNVDVAFSEDGNTWEQEQTLTMSPTPTITVTRATCFLERERLVARLRSTDCGNVRIAMMVPKAITGAGVKA
mgnify:CR=1 FL=1